MAVCKDMCRRHVLPELNNDCKLKEDQELLKNYIGGFGKELVKERKRSKFWDVEDDEEDGLGLASETSSVTSRQGSTRLESTDHCSSTSSLCSDALMDSMVDYHSPEETIIIFDWDDTICPTTALNEDGTQASGKALEDLVYEARLTLEKAREVAAEVVIVTNATDGWVESSCETWMPGLVPTLDTLEFSSARSAWEPMGILTPTGWKGAAFEETIRKFYSRYPRQSWKNIIVIGDACYEHEALAQVADLAPEFSTNRCRAKSIRFELQPSVASLARQLQMLRENLDNIVHHDDNLDLNFQSESL